MNKTIFVAKNYIEALTWAVLWGFSPATVNTDWYWVGRPEHARGLHNVNGNPVFVCGPSPVDIETYDSLRAGFFDTFIDAHDLVFYEPRSALDLIP